MITDLPEAHARALAETRRVVAGVGPDQWNQPTPCEDWDLHSLVNHLVAGNFWVAPLLGGQTIEDVGARYDGDILGSDPVAAYDRSASEARVAGLAPGAMSAPCAVSYGPVPGEVYVGHRVLDVVIHGWDIAKASGQDTALDPELVDQCWEIIEPQMAMLEASGMFGNRLDADAGASGEARLLATLGRRP
jgi:uncharacterized protein (TIGR03086 family)